MDELHIELLDPDGNPLRKWHARKIGKPYETEDTVLINLYSSVVERGLPESTYASPALANRAAQVILDYYGLTDDPATFPVVASAAGFFFPSRPLSNPTVQFEILKSALKNIPPRSPTQTFSGQEYQISMDIASRKRFIKYIGTAFKIYQHQLKFFNGAISPNINFLDLLDKVKLFFANLENFVTFNGYELSKHQSILLAFNENYKMVGATLYDRDSTSYALPKGVEYYFTTLKQGNNKYVNEIVTNFDDILQGRRSKINWTQFIDAFLPNAGIEINYYGKPRTLTEKQKLAQKVLDSPFGPLAIPKALEKSIREDLNNKANQQKAFKEAKKSYAKDQMSLQKRIEKIVKEIQETNLEEVSKVKKILTKYNVATLIEAALECLLFKGGFSGAVPDFIPGINPFDPRPPALPLAFPAIEFKLPIISINKVLQVQIKEGLKRAAISAVMSLIQTIADIIKELCLTNPNDNDVVSTPPQDIIDQFDPTQINNLYACYEDFGFERPAHALTLTQEAPTSGDNLEAFLVALSPLITARELCDLLNGVAEPEIFQVINNLIDSSWPTIRPHFPYSLDHDIATGAPDDVANEALEQFFLCLGNLIDPDYCVDVYNNLTPTIPEIDPCTIEDAQPFKDIMDLLDNVNMYGDVDMGCGAGIVPALADIAAYNAAVIRLIDSILAPAQQTFVSDIGNYKEIIIQQDPLSAEDQEDLDRDREILKFLQGPDEEQIPGMTDKDRKFFNNLIPPAAASAFEGLQNIANNLAAMAGDDQVSLVERITRMLANRPLRVAGATHSLYDNIEDFFLTSAIVTQQSTLTPEQALRYYSFLTTLNFRADSADSFGRAITYSINGGTKPDKIKIYSVPVRGDITADLQTTAAGPLSARAIEAKQFKSIVLNYLTESRSWSTPSSGLDSIFQKKLYPFMYLSLINSFAYEISKSDLFDPVSMNNFSLLPRVCTDGSISNWDLMDINTIKQEALAEFANNSCIEGNYELGPVRDAGLLALVSTYMQVLIVDLMLKNIFMVSKFGVDYLSSSPDILNELLNQSQTKILEYLGGTTAVGETTVLPGIVKKAAALVVKKIIVKDPASFAYPISGAPTSSNQVGLLDSLIQLQTLPELPQNPLSAENPILQTMAIRYLFEKRLKGTTEKVKEYFGLNTSTPVESYLTYGMPHVELADFEYLPYGLAAWENTLGPSSNPGPACVYMVRTGQMAASTVYTPDDTYEGSNTSGGGFFALFKYIGARKAEDKFSTATSTAFDKWFDGLDILTKTAGPPLELGFAVDQDNLSKFGKEVAAYEKYGSIVMERYFKVVYSQSQLDAFLDAGSENSQAILMRWVADDIPAFFANRTPLTTTFGIHSTDAMEEEDGPLAGAASAEYLMSFDAFKALFDNLVSILALRQTFLPIPLYLTGYSPMRKETTEEMEERIETNEAAGSGDTTAARIGVAENKNPIEVAIEISDPDYQDQDRKHLSDYNLIKSWCKAVRSVVFSAAGPYIDQADQGTQHVQVFSPDNEYAFDRANAWNDLEDLGQVVSGRSGGLRTWVYPVFKSPSDYDYYAVGNYLLNASLFDGVTFAANTPGEWTYLRRDWQEGGRYYLDDEGDYDDWHNKKILESKNFMIVLNRPNNPDDELDTWMSIRSKTHMDYDKDAEIGGNYSSLDFLPNADANPAPAKKMHDLALSLFHEYNTEQELKDAIFGLTTPLEDIMLPAPVAHAADGSPIYHDPEPEDTYLSDFFKEIFPSIKMGSRLAYLTPSSPDWTGPLAEVLGGPEGFDVLESARKYKSFFLAEAAMFTEGAGGDQKFAHIAMGNKSVDIDVASSFLEGGSELNTFLRENGTTQGFDRFVEEVYQRKFPSIVTGMASKTLDLFGDGKIVDVPRIMQYLFLVGELRTYYSLFAQQDIFNDTKQTLTLAMAAAFAGDDPLATSACDKTALQNMMLNGATDALGPLSSLGNSFINKMLINTPKAILKGIVELCEPHVIVASKVKEVSKSVFQGMDMGLQAAATAAALGEIGASLEGNRPSACDEELGIPQGELSPSDLDPPPDVPSLDELVTMIQREMDQLFPERFPKIMKPQVTKDGIDLEGTLPFLAMLPPLTPFGIIYLLLRLGEYAPPTAELEENCETTGPGSQLNDT